jgi:hypothetical protein
MMAVFSYGCDQPSMLPVAGRLTHNSSKALALFTPVSYHEAFAPRLYWPVGGQGEDRHGFRDEEHQLAQLMFSR